MGVEEVIDALYALPLEEFTHARNEAAEQLRGEGRRDDAERVKGLRKPTAAAAAVNRLVREHGDDVEQFLRAAVQLRDAQFAGKGDVAAATRAQREALERLIRVGGEAVRQSLLAAAVDDEAAAQLREARLERELEPRGFGTLLTHARPAKPPQPAKPKKPDDTAARARLQAAKASLSSAEREEREARHRWERAQRKLEQAQAAVERARQDSNLRPAD